MHWINFTDFIYPQYYITFETHGTSYYILTYIRSLSLHWLPLWHAVYKCWTSDKLSTNQLKVIRHMRVTRTCHVYNTHNTQRKNTKTCGVVCMHGNACTSDVSISKQQNLSIIYAQLANLVALSYQGTNLVYTVTQFYYYIICIYYVCTVFLFCLKDSHS